MTVITPASDYANPDAFDPRRDAKLRRRVLEEQQTEALRRRLAERAQPRMHNEDKLASSRSLVDANDPARVALRLDRLTRYYTGDELPVTTPTESPERLKLKAVERAPVPNSTPPERLLEAIINTAAYVGPRRRTAAAVLEDRGDGAQR